jgi:two-component system LytT family response regulator
LIQFSYLVVCSDEAMVAETTSLMENFPEFFCVGTVSDKNEAIDYILEYRPQIVLLDISPNPKSNLSLQLMTELHQYINQLPAFIALADNDKLALEAIKAGIFDYLLKPVKIQELRKSLLKYQKHWSVVHHHYVDNAEDAVQDINDVEDTKIIPEVQKSDVDIQICIKSYGDYQFIALKDVVYLEADNNTTDFYLLNGKKLSAYKTLKHYENNLPSFFYRIHNSYIVNSNYVSRINTGKQLCYLNNNEVSVSFSKTFKENIDTIIKTIAPEYL